MFSSHDKMLPYASPRTLVMERRWKPAVEMAPNCPRCDSSNTKFCYYNNYSLSQPRYFCKDCRRYWTKGGSLRNVPVGGGCRKNRRPVKPIRTADTTAGHRDASYACKLPPSDLLRPDMALDGMAGSSCQSNGTGAVSSLDVSSSDGSSIDLALLYSKFSKQCPELEPAGPATMESNELFGLVTASDSTYQIPVGECQDPHEMIPGAMFMTDNGRHQPSIEEEVNLFMDPNCVLEPLSFPTEEVGSDDHIFSAVFPSLASQQHKFQGFGFGDEMIAYHNPPLVDWTALDQFGLDAFYAS